MAVSVRMDPLLEKQLELAAKRQGISKSQFIIAAVERALGRKDPYALMMQLKAEELEDPAAQRNAKAFAGLEQDYESEASRAALIARLKAKHGLGAD